MKPPEFFIGRVGPLPIADENEVRDKYLNVYYIKLGNNAKLAVEGKDFGTTSEADDTTYYRSCQRNGSDQEPCHFPHDPTTNQNFSDGQFSAYYALGMRETIKGLLSLPSTGDVEKSDLSARD